MSQGRDLLQILQQKADIGVGLDASRVSGPQSGLRLRDHQLPRPLVPFQPGPVELGNLPGRKT